MGKMKEIMDILFGVDEYTPRGKEVTCTREEEISSKKFTSRTIHTYECKEVEYLLYCFDSAKNVKLKIDFTLPPGEMIDVKIIDPNGKTVLDVSGKLFDSKIYSLSKCIKGNYKVIIFSTTHKKSTVDLLIFK